MTDDERDPKSFEETVREIADEVRRSIERASQGDPEELARAVGVDPEKVRDWVDTAGEWLRAQVEGAAGGRDPRSDPRTPAGEDLFRDAEPHPLDVPTQHQGPRSPRSTPGAGRSSPGRARSRCAEAGPGPVTPSGWSASCGSATGSTRTAP